jgi:hypothetical protein
MERNVSLAFDLAWAQPSTTWKEQLAQNDAKSRFSVLAVGLRMAGSKDQSDPTKSIAIMHPSLTGN